LLRYVAKWAILRFVSNKNQIKKAGKTMTNHQIGAKLKNLRKSRKLTQAEFAEKVGVSRSTLSCYEIDQRTPSVKTLQHIAQMFGVGLDYFGISTKDEAFELLARAKEVFENEAVSTETKEQLYTEFMKLYLAMKE
jgi:transcriptional regulator with XRE-family HTH domain